jgi:ABC-type multidrug transport system ATPase subunit
VLSITGLARRFGDREVVRSLDLELAAGERAALWGPNGSGKSTVLRCVAGTLSPSAGAVTVGGHGAETVHSRALVGAVLALERSLYLRLTGRDNLILFGRLRGMPRKRSARAVDAIVEELELGEIASRRAAECSTGMLQQVVFARALVGDPPLLALDEPTRSLDEAATARVWAAIERRPRCAVLIATHRAQDAERCGTRIDLPR